MKKSEINALETRFKATTLMVIHLELDKVEEVNKLVEMSANLFDEGEYKVCKKSIDLLDSVILDILIN